MLCKEIKNTLTSYESIVSSLILICSPIKAGEEIQDKGQYIKRYYIERE